MLRCGDMATSGNFGFDLRTSHVGPAIAILDIQNRPFGNPIIFGNLFRRPFSIQQELHKRHLTRIKVGSPLHISASSKPLKPTFVHGVLSVFCTRTEPKVFRIYTPAIVTRMANHFARWVARVDLVGKAMCVRSLLVDAKGAIAVRQLAARPTPTFTVFDHPRKKSCDWRDGRIQTAHVVMLHGML
jgi:hypothetical protein